LTIHGECITQHPILDVFNNPNPYQNGVTFREQVISYWLLYGNAFIEGVFSSSKHLEEIYALDPQKIDLVLTDRGFPHHYTYGSSYTVQRHIPIHHQTGRSSLFHIKFFNPFHLWMGLSPLESIRHSLTLCEHIETQNLAFLKRASRPTGALVVDNPHMNDEDKQQFERDLKDFFSGPENAGRPLLLFGNASWTPFHTHDMEMDFSQSKKNAYENIAMAYGVPYELLTSVKEPHMHQHAWMFLWEHTILPLARQFFEAFSQWIFALFNLEGQGALTYDEQALETFISKKGSRAQIWDSLSCLTVNEKRGLMGFPSLSLEEHRLLNNPSALHTSLNEKNKETKNFQDFNEIEENKNNQFLQQNSINTINNSNIVIEDKELLKDTDVLSVKDPWVYKKIHEKNFCKKPDILPLDDKNLIKRNQEQNKLYAYDMESEKFLYGSEQEHFFNPINDDSLKKDHQSISGI
jgi:HK97 family phage portal protein